MSIEIPGFWLLILFAIFAGLIVISAIIHLYHAFRFGSSSLANMISSGAYILGLGLILVVTWSLLRDVSFDANFILEIPAITLYPPTP